MNTYRIGFNENNTMYEVHAEGCNHSNKKHISLTHMAYLGESGAWVAQTFERENEGCLTKISPCAKKI
jgi:hypothetical protein